MKIGENSFGRYFNGLEIETFGLENETLKDTVYYLVYLREKEQAGAPDRDWAYVVSNYTLFTLLNAPEVALARDLLDNRMVSTFDDSYRYYMLGKEYVAMCHLCDDELFENINGETILNTDKLFPSDENAISKDVFLLDIKADAYHRKWCSDEQLETLERQTERKLHYLLTDQLDEHGKTKHKAGIPGKNGKRYIPADWTPYQQENKTFLMIETGKNKQLQQKLLGFSYPKENDDNPAQTFYRVFSKMKEYWKTVEESTALRGCPLSLDDIESLETIRTIKPVLQDLFYRITLDELAVSDLLLKRLLWWATGHHEPGTYCGNNPYDEKLEDLIRETLENDIHVAPIKRNYDCYEGNIWDHRPTTIFVEMKSVCEDYWRLNEKQDNPISFESFLREYQKRREEYISKGYSEAWDAALERERENREHYEELESYGFSFEAED